ncbi:hypothetical protein PNEG_00605 [Pneumocystis murina B123]|uniref:Ubiquitin-like domain-containing protein n=1 Tax=Pneumocystis murina (strain B123) TaxID=1069680 RepID=M7PKL8_PNEMU|nr:hypothetical protein PNEG_00605 [Pneumocystis murina B123]EMR11004.1 hypothetical protein PNEG_00605 [Pneumocystis murina B123]
MRNQNMHSIDDDKGESFCKTKVRIKSSVVPYLSEFTIEINRNLTVGVLKNQISSLFKGYINTLDYQLIFDGCVVGNDQNISRFIKDDSNDVTFHLITVSKILSSSSVSQDLSMAFNVFSNDLFNHGFSGTDKTEQNVFDEGNDSSSNDRRHIRLPIYYQAAVVDNKPCLFKISNYPSVSVLNSGSVFSIGDDNSCQILLMSPENASQYLNQNLQNDSQFSRTAINPDPHPQDHNVNNDRLRMAFVHLWLFIRLAFFVGLFSVNSSWIRFCTLVFIALQFFFWHTGRLISIRLFFQRIINRDRDRDPSRNERSSLNSEHGFSQPTSYDQEDTEPVEFNWRRNLGHKILTFIISLFPLTE